MKKITLIISMFTLCVGFSSSTLAQETATASTGATIVAPITITNAQDMNFGTIAIQDGVAAVITMDTAGVRSVEAGISYPVAGGNLPAQFTVGGQVNYTYAVTLPVPASIILTNTTGVGAETMTVDTFNSTTLSGGTSTGTLSASGADTVSIGAKLHILLGQVPGVYTNASDLDVTVNYN